MTISTCHSAKGLEWPVVMVPGGKFCDLVLNSSQLNSSQSKAISFRSTERKTRKKKGEFYRMLGHLCTDSTINQNCRRLLYVACTRAQSLLYLQHTTGRGIAGDNQPRELSPFISAVTADNWVRRTSLCCCNYH